MAKEKVTLSIKSLDQLGKSVQTNLMYVNPDASDAQLNALADRTNALSTDIFQGANRIETRELVPGLKPRNFSFSTGAPSVEDELILDFTFDGTGIPYIVSCTTHPEVYYYYLMIADSGGGVVPRYTYAIGYLDPKNSGDHYVFELAIDSDGEYSDARVTVDTADYLQSTSRQSSSTPTTNKVPSSSRLSRLRRG